MTAVNRSDWLGFPPGTVRMEKPEEGDVRELPDGSFDITYRLTRLTMTDAELRALDAEVHTKVMGERGGFLPYVVINGRRHDVETWLPVGWTPDEPPAGWCAGWRPPRYSTEIAAAWRVVEKMSATHWCRITTPFFPDDRCYAQFDLHNHSDATNPLCVQMADTVPEAICRAALMAIEQHAARLASELE